MMNGNVPPLRPLRPFLLIAGLPAHWYYAGVGAMRKHGSRTPETYVRGACEESKV